MTSNLQEAAQARKSSVSVALVLLLVAAWNFYQDRPAVYLTLGGIAAFLLLAGFCVPPAARAFHYGWMKFAHALGWLNSRILLSLMYYLVFTPFGVVSRLVGRNPLHRRGAAKPSYWIERRRTRQPAAQFERLF